MRNWPGHGGACHTRLTRAPEPVPHLEQERRQPTVTRTQIVFYVLAGLVVLSMVIAVLPPPG
jgi:hypothetical protein